MNHPVSKVFHAKLSFEINGPVYHCLAVEGDIQILFGCKAKELIEKCHDFKAFFHPDDYDVAEKIFEPTPFISSKPFTFRLIAADVDKVTIVNICR